MSELADEAEAVHANVTRLQQLSTSLETFNESFASYLYIMEMNSLTVDWPQVSSRNYDLSLKEKGVEQLWRHRQTRLSHLRRSEKVC